jgi:hypothetical protein
MIAATSRKLILLIAVNVLTIVLAPSVWAGILNGHGAAYGGVTGTAPFNNGVGLSGTIDYAVFTSSAFNANFSGLGYVPASPLVYTYQVFVTGGLGVSAELVGPIVNPANTIGTFDIGDQDSSSESLIPTASWFFSPEIPTGMSSWGLAYSSPNIPIVGGALTIDGGTNAVAFGLPVPGPIGIPEPGTLLMMGTGLLVPYFLRRSRR